MVEETFQSGTSANRSGAFIRTNMSHTAYRLLTALAAEGVTASLAENDCDFGWMAEAVHSIAEPRAASFYALEVR